MIDKLPTHYSMQSNPTVYDEEALTALHLAARTTGKVNECIDSVNNFTAEYPNHIETNVNKWLDNHPEATTTVQDKSLTEVKFTDTTLAMLKNFHVSPQMFGAVGDGVTDDTTAILRMIEWIEHKIPMRNFENEDSAKDYSRVRMQFDGCYLITSPIRFQRTYGLRINHLSLIAGDKFTGDAMLVFEHGTRNASVTNTTINGRLEAPTCVMIQNYSLTVDFSNVEITQFKKYGFYGVDKGHELKFVNVKINQVEWGHESSIKNLLAEGTGLYLGEERHDNQFTNIVVNYCHTYAMHIKGGTNVFVSCHFYGGVVNNAGLYNTFQNCYFDNTPLKTAGLFMICNNVFLKSSGTEPFIYLMESATNAWRYDTAMLNNNLFKANEHVPVAIDLGELDSLPAMNTISNTFYYVEPFISTDTKGNAPVPWNRKEKFFGDASGGYMTFGDLKVIWGTKAGNDETWVIYPNGITLTETYYVGLHRIDGNTESGHTPFAADLRADRFWPNSIGQYSTARWLVIGR